MRTPLGGPVATLLMFVPLVAIPLFAVFGTPQISTTGSPATQVEELKFASEKDKSAAGNSLPEADLVSAVQVSDGTAATQDAAGQNGTGQNATGQTAQNAAQASATAATLAKNDADPFAEFVRPANGENRPSDPASANANASTEQPPVRGPAGGATNAQPQKTALAQNDAFADDGRAARPDREPAGNSAGEPATERSRPKSETRMTAGFDANRGGDPSDEAKGLRAGIARLNALGITDYQWQPGDRDGEFLFRCRLASKHNPRMMQRFEAEAGEPLAALEKVLVQIDEWRAQRSRRAVRTSVGDAPANATVMAPRDENRPASTLDISNR